MKNDSKKRTIFCDLHCHCLPGMDDGCKTPEESIRLLAEEYRQGCRGVVSTSHYYPQESIASFLDRRERAAERLYQALDQMEAAGGVPSENSGSGGAENGGSGGRSSVRIPALTFGAEVAFRESLVNDPELERLCFGKSRYLLLEMPFAPWTERTIREVEAISGQWGIRLIIAHIERYRKFADRKLLERLMDSDALIQLNAGNFSHFGTAGTAERLIREGRIQVLGTDSHNCSRRPPNMDQAISYLTKKGLNRELTAIMKNNKRIFLEAVEVADE